MRMQSNGAGLDLVARQVSLLKSFAKVADALNGVAAFLWMPGLNQRFDGPRRIFGTRPLAVSLEVGAQGSLTLAAAKSRPVRNRLRYEVILRKDFTQPMTADGRGSVLAFDNAVMARRGLNLLAALVRFGEDRVLQPRSAKLGTPRHPVFLVPFHSGEEQIDEGKLVALAAQLRGGLDSVDSRAARLLKELVVHMPHELPGKSLVDARIVPDAYIAQAVEQEEGYEDFTPVLGAPRPNPVTRLREMYNPARALLAERKISNVEALGQAAVDELVVAMRNNALLGERLAEDEIFDALCNPEAPLYCRRGVDGIAAERVVEAMRRASGYNRAAAEATDEDLLAAAYNPRAPLMLSRLSTTQIVAAADLMALPVPYSGSFLPELDWEPPRRRAAIAA